MWNYLTLLLLSALLQASPEREATYHCPQVCICDSAKKSVLCQNQNLTKVPASISQLTQTLDLSGNVLQVLPAGAFRPLLYLSHLDLQACQLKHVYQGAFQGLLLLSYLNLASNNISVLPRGALDGPLFLRQLVLENNQLKEIQPGTFSQLPFLSLLNLAHNSLERLPDGAFQGLPRAWWLQLSHNALSELAPESLVGLAHLRRLSLDHNKLEALPWEALAPLRGLVHLDLGHNPLGSLAQEEGLALPELRYLALEGATLRAVAAAALSRCPLLYTVDLRDNGLKTLPALQGLDRLHKLKLSGNPLRCDCAARPLRAWAVRSWVMLDGLCYEPLRLQGQHLLWLREEDLLCQGPGAAKQAHEEAPEEAAWPCPLACTCSPVSQHSSCENKGLRLIPSLFPNNTRLLDLNWNKFTFVPRFAFRRLGLLVSLHLQHCQITRVAPGALSGLGQLVYLYLSDNRLSELSAAALQGVPRLRYLYLDSNRFTRVPRAILWALPSLVGLHLEHNALYHLALSDFSGAGSLRWLHLNANNISHVSSGPALEGLYVGGHQLGAMPLGALEGVHPLEPLHPQISPEAFAGLEPGLRSLYLEKNQTLPAMDGFTQLEVLDLRENPLHCDCQLLPLHRWLAGQNLPGEATCDSPRSARGQKVREAAAVFEACLGKKDPPNPSTLQQDVPRTPAGASGQPVQA